MDQQIESKGPEARPYIPKRWSALAYVLILLGGVALPLVALGVELKFGMCAGAFFNVLPSLAHPFLVAWVPVANALLLRALAAGDPGRVRLLAWANGAAVGISLFYSIIFLPLLPIGVVAVAVYGMGLLILAPPLALAVSLWLRRRWVRVSGGKPRGFWPGLGCAMALLLALEMPSTVTRIGMNMAASEEPASRLRGIRLLRAVGNEGMMLRLCYSWPTRAMDLTGFLLSLGGERVGTEKARLIYYQALGAPFNSVPPPEKEKGEWLDFGRFDAEAGGASVAGMVPGLSLAASRIDATIDAQAALSYQEWTLEFRNDGDAQAEVRAQIELPPEGAVSRLTLWVNGEEREAAFASRGRTRAAYESVVKARRDPVLVTTQGGDRVLMQCFPVPGGGGRMKVRLGITAPLALSGAGKAFFHAPRFTERNFRIHGGEDVAMHSLWLEATGPIGDSGVRGNMGDTYSLRAARSEAWLAEGRYWEIGIGAGNHAAWTVDSAGQGKSFIRQWAETAHRAPLGKVTLAMDGSLGMRTYLAAVGGAVRRAGRPLKIVFAGSEEIRTFEGSAQEAGDWIERQPCAGGQDNVAALTRAWDAASRDRDGALLWITASQPVLVSPAMGLRQNLERGEHGPRFLLLQVANGPNRIQEELDGLPLSAVRFSGSLQAELESLLSLSPVTGTLLVRKRQAHPPLPGDGKRTSDHLARIFAHGEIGAMLGRGDASAREGATAMAAAYHLVTPVSGAVVLEDAGQYAAAGLEPAGAATVPGVPEPEMVWLMAAVAAMAALHAARTRPWRRWRSRRRA